MKFYWKQNLSAFLMLSLVWVFASCIFLCSENEICVDEHTDAAEVSVSFENSPHGDVCPIQSAAKTTVQERIFFKLEPATVSGKFSTNFSAVGVVSNSFAIPTQIYSPPKITSHNKRTFTLRI